MNMNNDTIDLRLSKSRQSWNFTRVSRINGHILQTHLHIDSSYSEQSTATVSLWTPNGWTPISSHPGAELHAYHTFPSTYAPNLTVEDAQEDFEVAANILEGPALNLLDGAK